MAGTKEGRGKAKCQGCCCRGDTGARDGRVTGGSRLQGKSFVPKDTSESDVDHPLIVHRHEMSVILKGLGGH